EVAGERAPDARYVLFTDADIRHSRDNLSRLVDKAERDNCVLVSLMALLDARGPWASLLVPAFVYFFQMLYPFPLSNNPKRKVAAGAGGCMLVRRERLEAVGGLEPIKSELIDDCALARLLKGEPPRQTTWIGVTRAVKSQRDNRSLGSIWNMVARTAFTQLKHSADVLTAAMLGLAFIFLLGPLVFLTAPLHENGLAMLLGLAAWLAMAASFAPTLRLYRKPVLLGFALPVAAALYMAMTVSSALRHWRGQGGEWKGRTYAADRPAA
ncbi:MAG: glycosyltransferase, partial [Pseudomonadota bacterium]